VTTISSITPADAASAADAEPGQAATHVAASIIAPRRNMDTSSQMLCYNILISATDAAWSTAVFARSKFGVTNIGPDATLSRHRNVSAAMPRSASIPDFPKRGHDHAACGHQALAEAEAICTARGLRLTELRRRVLETIWQDHAPLGAYDILARINSKGERNAPMAVYRALDFLMENGLAHRLSSRNAYVGCRHPGHSHSGQFLICSACDTVAEIASPALSKTVARAAAARGFKPEGEVVEVTGLCPNCRGN
jgi:Fur family zinc uptake transcriptional regulator